MKRDWSRSLYHKIRMCSKEWGNEGLDYDNFSKLPETMKGHSATWEVIMWFDTISSTCNYSFIEKVSGIMPGIV